MHNILSSHGTSLRSDGMLNITAARCKKSARAQFSMIFSLNGDKNLKDKDDFCAGGISTTYVPI